MLCLMPALSNTADHQFSTPPLSPSDFYLGGDEIETEYNALDYSTPPVMSLVAILGTSQLPHRIRHSYAERCMLEEAQKAFEMYGNTLTNTVISLQKCLLGIDEKKVSIGRYRNSRSRVGISESALKDAALYILEKEKKRASALACVIGTLRKNRNKALEASIIPDKYFALNKELLETANDLIPSTEERIRNSIR